MLAGKSKAGKLEWLTTARSRSALRDAGERCRRTGAAAGAPIGVISSPTSNSLLGPFIETGKDQSAPPYGPYGGGD